jgi:hypothetical protein
MEERKEYVGVCVSLVEQLDTREFSTTESGSESSCVLAVMYLDVLQQTAK